MLFLNPLTVTVPISHIRLQDGHFLLIATILSRKFLHELIYKGVLPADDLIHSHANLIEPLVEIILIGFKLIYLSSYFVIFGVDHHQVLLDFAHHVVHCLLLSPQLEQLLCAGLLLRFQGFRGLLQFAGYLSCDFGEGEEVGRTRRRLIGRSLRWRVRHVDA